MEDLKIYTPDFSESLRLPYADGGVRAGFPSPAQDFVDCRIDLNRDLVAHPESTFYARVAGDSMKDAGVAEGDILVIDKSIDLRSGDMAVCVLNGEFTLKYVERHRDHALLVPANDAYRPIRVEEYDHFEVWGVVTYIIHKARRR